MKTVILDKSNVISVKEDTKFIFFGGSYDFEFIFDKPGVTAEVVGVYKLMGDKTVKLSTIANHKAPNTGCSTKIRGVLLDNSTSDYLGKIIIEKTAQQTVSYLDDKVLTLGAGVKNISQPILEIDADEVKASHGATSGSIDSDQLYYLQSRGLSREEATELVIKGFFEQVLVDVSQDIKDEIYAKLDIC